MEYQRLFDKSIIPTEESISLFLKEKYLIWNKIYDYILSIGKIQVETKYFTKNYGWSMRFFKGSKTICYLFPENNAFSILIVFGQKEIDLIEKSKDEINTNIFSTIQNTEHFHDGRWVWLHFIGKADIKSLEKLIDIKTNRKNA